MRLGLFGGTFNPIHLAHLITAENLREKMSLDRVLFIPSALPPHKDTPVTPASHRLAMTRLAVASNPYFEASDIEVSRGGRSYSIDTLREMERAQPDSEFFFIIGMDAFSEIKTWKESSSLFELTNFLIIPRPGHPLGSDPLSFLPSGIREKVILEDRTKEEKRFHIKGAKNIYVVNTTLLDISSSDIRGRIGKGRSVRYLVPGEVASYIMGKNLYKSS